MTGARPAGLRMRRAFLLALSAFVFAGVSGVWMRAAAVGLALPTGSTWENMRHAHSHVMFFSWVTPGLMAVITQSMRRLGASMPRVETIMVVAVLLGIASFFPFMMDGYGTSNVAGRQIPLSVIFSTLSMFTWYAFGWQFWRGANCLFGAARPTLRIAVAALILSTIGAWLRGAFVGLHVTDRFATDGAVHAFVTTFSLGWLLVGTLGVLHLHRHTPMSRTLQWANGAIAFGLAGTWIMSVAKMFVPPTLWTLGAWCSFVFGFGALTHVATLWQRGSSRLVLVPAALVSLAQAYAGLPGVMLWADANKLRVPYLHALFLLVVSVTLIDQAQPWLGHSHTRNPQNLTHRFAATSWLLVAGIFPTTMLWPSLLRSAFDPWVVAVTAVFPVVVGASLVWRFWPRTGVVCR